MQKLPEADLANEASNAAGFYMMQKVPKDNPESATILNACARGFYMGVRWYEKHLAEKENERKVERIGSTGGC